MEEIATGVTREWLNEGRVVSYTVSAVSVASINAWSATAIDTLEHWPEDHPYLALHDVSQPGMGLLFLAAVGNDIFNIGVVPSAQQRVQEIVESRPDWQLALAIVVSASLSGRMTKLLFQQTQPGSRIQVKAFFHRSAALKWLDELEVSAEIHRNPADVVG